MSNILSLTVHQVDNAPLAYSQTIQVPANSFIVETRLNNIPAVKSMVLVYDEFDAFKTYYVSETIAYLVASANETIISLLQATVTKVGNSSPILDGQQMAFPADQISLLSINNGGTKIIFKNKTYLSSDSITYLLSNANSGGISDSTQSKYLLTADNNILSFNGVLSRKINDKSSLVVYRMPNANLVNQFDKFTLAGAMTSAVITNVGGYDNIVVGGSDFNTYIRFDNQNSFNDFTYKIKVRIDAIGVTAPLLGIRGICPTVPTYAVSCSVNSRMYGYVNLLTGVISDNLEGTAVTQNSWATAAIVGDIIEIEHTINYLKGSQFVAYKSNQNGQISTLTRTKTTTTTSRYPQAHPSIIMTDGTYTLLDFSIISPEYKPKILVTGDSMSTGVNILYDDSIKGKLGSKIPFRVSCTGASSQMVGGLLANIWAVLALQPEYVLIVTYVQPLLQGAANPDNVNYAAWNAQFTTYIGMLKSLGCRVVFVHPEQWDSVATPPNAAAYYTTYLNTNYPNDIKIYVPNSEAVYDSTGFHYAGPTNGYIADQLIQAIEAQGGFEN